MKYLLNYRKHIYIALLCIISFSLLGCGKSEDTIYISENGFNLEYNGDIQLEKLSLNDDDLDEIIGLYQETGNNIGYVDSLLIAEKYAMGMGVNTFVQENLAGLKANGLSVENIKKSQIGIKTDSGKVNSVLLEYEIIDGFIESIPLLYLSQLYIPNGDNMILYSYITEDKSARTKASNMLKNIK